MKINNDLAVYIHWPFCKFKCPYCDFNSHVRDRINHSDWKQAYLEEMKFYRDKTGARAVQSVFFGGGTPSLMEPDTVAAVIEGIDQLWGLPSDIEITIEANPTSVEAGKLQGFKSAGVNRVSLGVQSLRDGALQKLGRQHSADEAITAVKMAAKIFDRYSFDLIYARPMQSLAEWKQELSEALEFAGDHMSLYQLTIEEGTQYHTLFQRGEITIPDDSLAADFYELTQEMMEAKGLPAYEVSNHARIGQESRHNLVYWRYGDYVGIGPGAHGRLTFEGEKWATRAHKVPEVWLERVAKQSHGAHPFESVNARQRGQELLMMGLRLSEGVSLAVFHSEIGMSFADYISEFFSAEKLATLMHENLLALNDSTLTATISGRLKLNGVLNFLLKE